MREQRLARARRADHQQVVRSGGRDLERALGEGLPLDVGEVVGGSAGRPRQARLDAHQGTRSAQVRSDAGQVFGGQQPHAVDQRRFVAVGRGQQQ